MFNLTNRQDTYLTYATPSVSNPSAVDAAPPVLTPTQRWAGSARQVQVGLRFAF